MMHQAIRWLTACALVCVGLLIGRVDVRAGDKQGGTPAPGGKASIFKANGTALDLKDAKGKYDGELNADDPQVQNHYYKIFLVKMETGKTYRIGVHR